MNTLLVPTLIIATLLTGACRENNDAVPDSRPDPGPESMPAGAARTGDDGTGPSRIPLVPTTVLYGRVLGSDTVTDMPSDWQVRVTAEYEDRLRLAPHDRDSTGDLFAFKVVPGRRVRLHFEAVPYEATMTEFIEVTDDRSYAYRVPDVILERIRWSMAAFAEGDGEAFGRNLEQQASLAEKTGSADIFRANLEFYRKASEKFPDCRRRLEEFEQTARAREITTQAERRGLPVAVLSGLVMRPEALAAEQPKALLTVAQDTRVLPGVRARALDALRTAATTPEIKAATVAVAVAAAEDPRSGIAGSALSTVQALGTEEQALAARRKLAAAQAGRRDASVTPQR